MADSKIRIQLDTVRKNNVKLIYAAQNDYGARYITAEILTDGEKNAVSSTAAVSINAKRTDGEKSAFSGTVNADGTVTVPVTQWMLAYEGEVVCSISAVESGKRLTTTHFYLQAQESVWDGTSAPSADDPNKDVILEIIASENERISNENARISAENARKTAETARADAESTRISNEAARVANESERVSAETVRKTEFATWQGEIGKISAFDKRIENLEAAVTPGLVTPTVDDSVAYVKDVPTGALPFASVSEIGGMTRKCTNLLKTAVSHQWQCTATVADDGKLTMTSTTSNGTVFAIAFSAKVTANQSYYFKLYNRTNISRTVLFADAYGTSALLAFDNEAVYTPSSDRTVYVALYLNDITSGAAGSCYVMMNKGETALPYEPYFEGLRDAKVTAVESVGANLFDKDQIVAGHALTTTGGSYTDADFCYSKAIAVKEGASYITKNVQWCNFYTDDNSPSSTNFANQIVTNIANEFTVPSGAKFVRINVRLSNIDTARFYNSTTKHTIPIPEAVQALDGYGQGISKDYHNKIVFDPAERVKKFVKTVEKQVFDDTDEWIQDSNENGIYFIAKTKKNSKPYTSIICDDYPNQDASVGVPCVYLAGQNNVVFFVHSSITSATEWESYLAQNPMNIVYMLEKPEETDISDYFGDDNLIGVEAGGTVTAVNEYEYDVPSVMEYTVKGADAT